MDFGKVAALEDGMIRKKLYYFAAFASLGFGIAGIFLPLLPTTPFVLLSAFCFLRSSPSRYQWLVGHKVFGRYISDYLIHRAIPLRAKVLSIVLMWFAMGVSAFILGNKYITVGLFVVGVAVTLHILSLRISKKPAANPLSSDDMP